MPASGNWKILDSGGSYAAMNPVGLYTDNLHPSTAGYADLAPNLASALLAPVGR